MTGARDTHPASAGTTYHAHGSCKCFCTSVLHVHRRCYHAASGHAGPGRSGAGTGRVSCHHLNIPTEKSPPNVSMYTCMVQWVQGILNTGGQP